MSIRFQPLNQEFVDLMRAGGADANGQAAEHSHSDGGGNPCRSCLGQVPKGAGMLVLAARPFPEPQPYAETGPVFLCAETCAPWTGEGVPPVLTSSPNYLLKGYGRDNRIIYGTGQITEQGDVESYAETLLSRQDVAYVDVRSSRNNCFLTRITRPT